MSSLSVLVVRAESVAGHRVSQAGPHIHIYQEAWRAQVVRFQTSGLLTANASLLNIVYSEPEILKRESIFIRS
jgi:hypothetical protein